MVKEKFSRFYKFKLGDYKIESCIMDVTKPRSFYISIPLWINVGDEEFEDVMKEFEKKIKWRFTRTIKDYFKSCDIDRSIIFIDWPESNFKRLKDKNTYVQIEITAFTNKDVDFDTVRTKGINNLVLDYTTDCLNFIKDIDGLCFSNKK
jgi:hypothetical protein